MDPRRITHARDELISLAQGKKRIRMRGRGFDHASGRVSATCGRTVL